MTGSTGGVFDRSEAQNPAGFPAGPEWGDPVPFRTGFSLSADFGRLAIHFIWREVVRIEARPLSLELPVSETLDWTAAALSALALVAVFRLKLGMATVLSAAAALGLLLYGFGLA